MTPLLAAAAVAVMAGAAVQAATGFGFALLAAPLAFAALDAREAIGLLLLLGIEIGVLTLATEGRRPQPMVRRCAAVLLWAIPAAVAGVAVLRALDAVALQIAVSLGVVATLLVRRRAPAGRPGAEPRWAAPAAGLSAGALVTSTNTSGPPLLLYLLGRGDEPARVRDTLTVCQLGLSLIGVAALAATSTSGAAPRAWLVALFAPARAPGPPRRPPGVRAARGQRALRARAQRDARPLGHDRAADRRAVAVAFRGAIGSGHGPGSR